MLFFVHFLTDGKACFRWHPGVTENEVATGGHIITLTLLERNCENSSLAVGNWQVYG